MNQSVDPSLKTLEEIARRARRTLLQIHFEAQAGHIGGSLSCIDILTFIFARARQEEDEFILSKGHSASALYATLHATGRMTEEVLKTYYKDGTQLAAHPNPYTCPEIRFASGSLGHGLSVATGMAYAATRLRPSHSPKKIFCLLSDGECNEGSTWEAALFAGHHRLQNLIVFVDANGLQGFGATKDILNTEPLPDKWRAFGFDAVEVAGHSFTALVQAVAEKTQSKGKSNEKPVAFICRTVKGKGVSFMENRFEWHYLPLDATQYERAMQETQETGGAGL